MSIYDVNGKAINAVYNIGGHKIGVYYDVDGNAYSVTKTKIGELVAMSFNVGHWNSVNETPSGLNYLLDTYAPDLMAMQEYDEKQSVGGVQITNTINDYFSNFERAEWWAVGSPTYALNNAEALTFSTGRTYQKMYITIGGKSIAVFNVHMTWESLTSTKRITEAKELFDIVANEEYFIIIGDLNLTCRSTTDRDYIEMVKQFEDAGYNVANCSPKANIAYRYPENNNLAYEMPDAPSQGFVYTCTESTTSTYTDEWYAHDSIITSANIEIAQTEVDLFKTTTPVDYVKLDHFPLISYLTVYEFGSEATE